MDGITKDEVKKVEDSVKENTEEKDPRREFVEGLRIEIDGVVYGPKTGEEQRINEQQKTNTKEVEEEGLDPFVIE